jgi:flagellum-specific ATP synthase
MSLPPALGLDLDKYFDAVARAHLTLDSGKITHVVGNLMTGYLPGAAMGSVCEVHPQAGFAPFSAEVVGFRDRNVLLMPLGDMRGVGLGSRIIMQRQLATVRAGTALLGRVIDGLGEPLDGKGPMRLATSA